MAVLASTAFGLPHYGNDSTRCIKTDIDKCGIEETIIANGKGVYRLRGKDAKEIYKLEGIAGERVAIACGDIDGDGLPDIALSTSKGLEIILQNENGFIFEKRIIVHERSVLADTDELLIDDIDNDGANEILISNSLGVSALKGDGLEPICAVPHLPNEFGIELHAYEKDGKRGILFGTSKGIYFKPYQGGAKKLAPVSYHHDLPWRLGETDCVYQHDGDDVPTLAVDGKTVYAATADGIYKIDSKIERIGHAPYLAEDDKSTLYFDQVTKILYASTQAGIVAVNTDTMNQEYLGKIKSLPTDKVSVFSNHDGTVTAISSLETLVLDDYGMRRN